MLPAPGGEEILGCGVIEEMTCAAMLAVAPLGAKAADLTVWKKGSTQIKGDHCRFERETGEQVGFEQPPQSDIEVKALAAVV